MAAILLFLIELEWNWCGSLALSFETNECRRKEGRRDMEFPSYQERENRPNRLLEKKGILFFFSHGRILYLITLYC